MRVSKRLTATGLAALMGVALLAGAPGAYASTMKVDVAEGVKAKTGVPTGDVVTGTGVSRKTPITITWGDGVTQVTEVSCSVRKAKSRPGKCRITAGHVYENPGVFDVQAQTPDGRVLASGQVTVTGQPSGPNLSFSRPEYQQSDRWRAQMISRVNQVRAENGAGPVGACPRLDQIAQDYAQLMADTGHYGHTGPNGESPWDRMRAGGYDYRTAAENIAHSYPNSGRVQEAWEKSDGHLRNMTNPNFSSVGLGAAQSPSGQWFWVQKYGSGGNCDLDGRIIKTPAPVSGDFQWVPIATS